MSSNISLCLCCVVLCILLTVCEGLKPKDFGVCETKTSEHKTKRIYYKVTINKMCGKKKCTVQRSKLKKYLETKKIQVCCNGFKYNRTTDTCEPICSTGCYGGKCVSPDVCQCEPPAVFDNGTCVTCNPPCHNAQCVNNTCVCNGDYTRHNATHCYHCEPGYVIDDSFNCTKCALCINGDCEANECVCHPGYDKREHTCEPRCDCVNSNCIAPHTCECYDGYKKVNATHCEPKCDSCNGTCVGPDQCECDYGYNRTEAGCVPVCETVCVNGYCSEPNVCACDDGFVNVDGDASQACVRACPGGFYNAETKDCVVSNCTKDEIFRVIKPVTLTKRCRNSNQICRKTVNVVVNTTRTSCCEGYVNSVAQRKCVPDCKLGCNRGTCVAPDTCQCEPPLILKLNISCEEPQCASPCVNSKCVDDDKCECDEGFSKHNATHCAPICPEGFFNGDNLECKPKCDNCNNGNCTAPNVCTCDEGYRLENSTCVPHCNETCENGNCVAPNTCACLAGYESINTWICKPKCGRCDNGECVAPNQCDCLDGYFKADGITCTPVCTKTCVNGYCSAPDICTCEKGYELAKEDKFTCQPTCTVECVNATCVSPDTCNCLPGFERLTSSVCKPFCKSCEHGVCVSPDNCQCNDGFSKNNGTCRPVCSSPCVNGYCESLEKCACNEGYLRDITKSVCYKPCVGDCDNGKCNVDGQCLCNSGYEFFNNSCIVADLCDKCNSTCDEDNCQCADGRPCYNIEEAPVEAATSTSLAGLRITWVLGGCIGILLMTILIITIGYIWRKRQEYGEKPADNGNVYSSVLYPIPNTLIQNKYDDNISDTLNEENEDDTKESVSLHLLEPADDENEKITMLSNALDAK